MKKQIFRVLATLAVGVSKRSMPVFVPVPGYSAETLTFTSITDDITADGYTWVRETKTFTITPQGLTIEVTNQGAGGIVLPAGAAIIVDGALTITSCRDAITCAGDLNINANANVNITSWSDEGIRVADGNLDITVAKNATMDIDGYNAIYVFSNVAGKAHTNVTVYGALNLNPAQKGAVGIRSQEAVTLKGTGTIYIYGSTSPIFAGVSVQMLETVSVGTDANDTFALTLGSAFPDTYSSTVTMADSVICNGLIADGENEVVYGKYLATTCFSLSGNGKNTLVFCARATVIINEGVHINLASYACITYHDVTIINNGTLVLPIGTDISALNIEGSGMVVIIQDDGLEAYYTNEGALQYMEGTATLEVKEVISDVYRWTVNAEGVYTLTLLSENNCEDASFVIMVDNAMINLTCDVEVSEIRFDEINTGTNLMITGGFTLTCAEIEGDGTLTIAQGTALVAREISMCLYGEDDTATPASALSNLVVSGILKSEELALCNLEVTNTGTLYLDGYFQAYSKTGAAPAVTLGEQIAIISPEGGYYDVTPSTSGNCYGYFYTGDGIGSNDDAFPALEIGIELV